MLNHKRKTAEIRFSGFENPFDFRDSRISRNKCLFKQVTSTDRNILHSRFYHTILCFFLRLIEFRFWKKTQISKICFNLKF